MGSPVTQPSPEASSDASVSPETLARVILRCRELATFLESSQPQLPKRAQTPFLYGQLDDVLKRLLASLRPLMEEESSSQLEGAAGFLRRLTGKKRAPRKSEARYDLEGNAWTIPVTELVGFLSHSGKSGLLWVISSVETFVLEFSRGSLVHATSNAPPVAFRLGEILLEQKLLEPAELARLIGDAKSADDMLGSFLVRSGRLRHKDLQRALSIQVQQLFHRLMDAENALYRFQEGAQLLRSHGLEVNITQLLLESARKKDEERQKTEGAPPSPVAESPKAPAKAVQEALGVLDPEPAAALPKTEAPESKGETSEEPDAPASAEALPSPASKEE